MSAGWVGHACQRWGTSLADCQAGGFPYLAALYVRCATDDRVISSKPHSSQHTNISHSKKKLVMDWANNDIGYMNMRKAVLWNPYLVLSFRYLSSKSFFKEKNRIEHDE